MSDVIDRFVVLNTQDESVADRISEAAKKYVSAPVVILVTPYDDRFCVTVPPSGSKDGWHAEQDHIIGVVQFLVSLLSMANAEDDTLPFSATVTVMPYLSTKTHPRTYYIRNASDINMEAIREFLTHG